MTLRLQQSEYSALFCFIRRKTEVKGQIAEYASQPRPDIATETRLQTHVHMLSQYNLAGLF